MSTRSERAFRATRRIRPIEVRVRQPDGSIDVQTVDVDARQDKRSSRGRRRYKRNPRTGRFTRGR